MNLTDLEKRYTEVNSRKKFLESDLSGLQSNLINTKKQRDNLVKARFFINDVTESTLNLFKDRVEKLTTLAIRSVFDRPYNFKLLFEKKRNKVECPLAIEENGEIFVPIKEEKGGGVLPIIGFALRVVLWSLENPKSRPFMLLDEPVKGAIGHKGDLLNKCAMMLKEISSKLGLQIILITHEPVFLDIADRAYEVSHDGIESSLKLITEEGKLVFPLKQDIKYSEALDEIEEIKKERLKKESKIVYKGKQKITKIKREREND